MSKRKKKKRKNQEWIKLLFSCVILCLISLVLSYIIFQTDYLQPALNEVTTSYISFNNKDTTDMLKIKNIKKMSDKKGKSTLNLQTLKFKIEGEKGKEYSVILYPLTNSIEDKYVKFHLNSKTVSISNTINKLTTYKDGGKILFQGTIDHQEMTLQLWISKEYTKKVNENSFEIKIKPR